MEISVLDKNNKKVGNVKVTKTFENYNKNNNSIFRLIVAINANKRQNTAKVKNRSEVSGTGRKPWKQKGTGNARQGSRRAPQWIKGGVVFGPNLLRNYKQKINKKEHKIALKSAWKDKLEKKQIIIFKDEIVLKKPSTKQINKQFKAFFETKNLYYIDNKKNINLELSIRNIPNLNYCLLNNISVNFIIKAQKILMTKETFKLLEEKYYG